MKHLSPFDIAALSERGCQCTDWSRVLVTDDFRPRALRNVTFVGDVALGQMNATAMLDGVELPCGIENATIANCQLGDNCLVRNVDLLSGYKLESGAVVAQCRCVAADTDTTFGIGELVAVVNEGGGREVPLSANMTSNIAHMVAFGRTDDVFIKKTYQMAAAEAEAVKGKAVIAEGAQVVRCQKIKNVRIGENAIIDGAAELTNGTILSAATQPTRIGSGVVANTFVVAEGASIFNHAILSHAYIGQCSQVGNGFVGEHIMAFANCQLLCGEAVSVLAGPFTVSHHKTSLLIAGAYSFFNAGSATNASNHHYKLGPNHQMVLRRGAKTGSGSYVLQPADIGAFTLVAGHHKSHPDTQLFPFSYLIEKDGDSHLLIGQNLRTIGLFRDEDKWLQRDQRRPELRRDVVQPETLSPLTISTMIRAVEAIEQMSHTDAETLFYNGTRIRKALMLRAAKQYTQVVDAYCIAAFLEDYLAFAKNTVASADTNLDVQWVDCGGFVVAQQKIDSLAEKIKTGQIRTFAAWAVEFDILAEESEEEKHHWASAVAHSRHGLSYQSQPEELVAAAQKVVSAFTDLCNAAVSDARKEFSDVLSVSYLPQEYEAMHGTPETNKAIARCQAFYQGKMAVANKIISKFAPQKE